MYRIYFWVISYYLEVVSIVPHLVLHHIVVSIFQWPNRWCMCHFNEETVNPLFIHFPAAYPMRTFFLRRFNWPRVLQESMMELLAEWSQSIWCSFRLWKHDMDQYSNNLMLDYLEGNKAENIWRNLYRPRKLTNKFFSLLYCCLTNIPFFLLWNIMNGSSSGSWLYFVTGCPFSGGVFLMHSSWSINFSLSIKKKKKKQKRGFREAQCQPRRRYGRPSLSTSRTLQGSNYNFNQFSLFSTYGGGVFK